MSAQPKFTLYEQLQQLPAHLTGELLNGQLHAVPRPSWAHGQVETALSSDLHQAYGRGRGGLGGWWIIIEPEIHFVVNQEIMVPDIAGWRRERLPKPSATQKITTVPDWICEILSPSTKSKDREVKMPLYAHYGVSFAWLVDPLARTLEALECVAGNWQLLGQWSEDDQVTVKPFSEISIFLSDLWGE